MAHSERHVRLFRNGRNQALRIPREFELDGDEAILRKEGDRLIVEPIRKGHLLALLETLKPLEEPFPDVDEDLPPLDLAVVTANTREFTRVPGLKVENWLSD
jgi:antitoxin VapB